MKEKKGDEVSALPDMVTYQNVEIEQLKILLTFCQSSKFLQIYLRVITKVQWYKCKKLPLDGTEEAL